jgi:low affinity Fe/Cu permease
MSNVDDNHIHDHLERLAKIEPTQEASDRAMQRIRDTLMNDETIPKLRLRLPPVVVKLAVAAVLLIGVAFLAGRLSAPKSVDVEALQANLESSLKSSLETTIRQELLDEMENRLQLALAAERDTLKQELHQQAARDLDVFAEKTLTAVGNLTDQRFMEFARMVEAARIKDRQRVAAAFEYMGSRFGDGLVTLAAHTNELHRPEKN